MKEILVKNIDRIVLVITISWIIFYFLSVFKYSVNIPFADDHGHLLGYTNTFSSENVSNKIKLKHLWHNHTIHRTVLAKLTAVSVTKVFGELNFKWYIFIGNLGLVFFFILLYKNLNLGKNNKIHALIFALIVFVPIHTLSNWALCTFGYFYLMLLAALSFSFLIKGGYKNLMIAAIFAILSTLTYGAGLFVFLAAYIVLIINKDYKLPHFALWTAVFIGWAIFYLKGISRPDSYPPMGSMLFTNPDIVLGYFFANFGAFFKDLYTNTPNLKFVFGAIVSIFGALNVLLNWEYFKKNPFILVLLTYLLLVAAGSAMNRSNFGIEYAERDKFHFIPALFIFLVYISSYEIYKNKSKNIFWITLGCGLFIFVLKFNSQTNSMKNSSLRLSYQMADFVMKYPDGKDYMLIETRLNRISKGTEMGHFVPSSKNLLKPAHRSLRIDTSSSMVIESVLNVRNSKNILTVNGYAFIEWQHMNDVHPYLFLEKEGKYNFYEMVQYDRKDMHQKFWKKFRKDLTKSGVRIALPLDRLGLSKGTYNTGILLLKDQPIDDLYVHKMLDHKVTIK